MREGGREGVREGGREGERERCLERISDGWWAQERVSRSPTPSGPAPLSRAMASRSSPMSSSSRPRPLYSLNTASSARGGGA